MGPDLWITRCYGRQTKLIRIKTKLRSEMKLNLCFNDIIGCILLGKYLLLFARNCMVTAL